VLDIRTGLAGSVPQDRMALEVAAAPGRVVLNTRLGARAPSTRAAAP
jgi:hypothetical protein